MPVRMISAPPAEWPEHLEPPNEPLPKWTRERRRSRKRKPAKKREPQAHYVLQAPSWWQPDYFESGEYKRQLEETRRVNESEGRYERLLLAQIESQKGRTEMSACICNPHAEPNAERVPNCPVHGASSPLEAAMRLNANQRDLLTAWQAATGCSSPEEVAGLRQNAFATIAKLEREAAELRKDKERLDWLTARSSLSGDGHRVTTMTTRFSADGSTHDLRIAIDSIKEPR